MKKEELLKYVDDELLEKLFGFCYARTNDSYEAEELCSDIVFAIVRAANTDGQIGAVYPFFWKVARNVYADFSARRKKRSEAFCSGDAEEILLSLADENESEPDADALLIPVYRRIAYLTRAYREVMTLFYLDGLSVREIAERQKIGENTVRQRLFSARQKIRNEVEKMDKIEQKPVSLENIRFVIWGNGDPGWGDPRDNCHRMFSKHVVWLCCKKPMLASEIAEELNVPTVYVEEELEIQRKGKNGKYGLLRRFENGKYAVNFILLDKETIAKAHALYTEQASRIGDVIADFIQSHRDEYLALPYLNRHVDFNLVLWQQVHTIAYALTQNVGRVMEEKYFREYAKPERPFSVYGYVDYDGKNYGCGWDGIEGKNVCGYSFVYLANIYNSRIKRHFSCGHDLSIDLQLQLAIRAIEGLNVSDLSEDDREHAAKAIECGYLYREGERLYTRILVSPASEAEDGRMFRISERLSEGYFQRCAEAIAEKIAKLIKDAVPEYLLGEWKFANSIAGLPTNDAVIETLIEKGFLVPPENGVGAEGCWMFVQK